MSQVRSNLTEVAALGKCLLHHTILLDVETKDGLLQVAYTTVDQLRTPTASARREIKLLNQCYLQACNMQTAKSMQLRGHTKNRIKYMHDLN